ncbi:hypothetical protein AYI69_g9024 [Smittium culicis]|uniref:Ankyrin repeat protein n=1 Tax=Smittium culicis TaxID=133412 RepID=A0A1R1XFG2_9FUNG|nr:hypothetical protein AYI69_g9024 [Smittium culicis]
MNTSSPLKIGLTGEDSTIHTRPLIYIGRNKEKCLNIALMTSNVYLIKLLLSSYKISPNISNDNSTKIKLNLHKKFQFNGIGHQQLWHLVYHKQFDILDLLIESGLDVSKFEKIFFPAIQNSSIKMLIYLEKMGANFTRIDHEAFLLVCKSRDDDTIDFILPKFSEEDLSIPWYFKIACGYGNVKVVKYLVNYLPNSDFIYTDLFYKACKYDRADVYSIIYDTFTNKDEIKNFSIFVSSKYNSSNVINRILLG